ncbi:MAG: asparagine synthase (glutamine-hydrolyzing), partial [Campylobacterales bacterium]|nr:asparagine synthase (glutamine-hydrolyzing) [Campylobacterales bacterium]
LSIQDLSNSGNQPMESERYVIVFNGEIYNHLKIRKKLKKSDFKSSGDTETILYAFEEWGVERTISKMNGMFAIALFDKKKNKIYLIRDRVGLKPIYFVHKDGEFAFASTIKGLPNHLVGGSNPKALIQFMTLTYVPSTNCYFENVQKIKPGFFVEFDGEKIVETNYWKIPKEAHDIEDEEGLNRLEELIEKSVNIRLLADVEVGTFLSGGVDSSLVTAIAAKHSTRKIKTFSMGFEDKSYDESGYAKEIAKILQTDHHEFFFKPKDVLDLLESYSDAYDEPFGDASSLPMMLLSKETAKEVKVALSGDGGDELFLGYDRYYFTDNYFNKFRKIPKFLREPIGELFGKTNKDKLKKISYPFKNPTPENIYSVISTAVKPWEIKNIFNIEFLQEKSYSYLDLLELEYTIDKQKIPESFSFIDQRRYLPDDILVKVDRASMHYSLEARVPLLDYKIVEFANRLPRDLRENKRALKLLLEKHIPKKLIYRDKKGFSVPLKKWFKKELRDLLMDKIETLDYRFNKEYIRKLTKEHIEGNKNYEYIFWNLLQVK